MRSPTASTLLLYAPTAAAPRHATAIHFLRDISERKELLAIPYPVALGYLRIATHPRVFPRPLMPEEALHNLESLATLPNVRFLSERDGFFDQYREITGSVSARGNLVPDAHIATILR